jgi:hypothetical protein
MDNPIPNVPGLNYPTQKGMLSGNPRDSAIASQININVKQANLGNAVGGKKRKGGTANNNIVVPQFTMSYQPTGGPGQTPNSIIEQNTQTSTQTFANAVYDNYATIKGGNKYSWGCYSGGKSKKYKKSKKSLKKKKLKKSKKTKKSRKSRN